MSAPTEEKTASTTPTTATETPAQTTEEETHKVFVGNLSFTSTDESLEAHFGKTGNVIETIVVKHNRPKGYGFVGYATLAEAEKATKDLDKTELDGREISVQLAKPRAPKKSRKSKKTKKEQEPEETKKEEEPKKEEKAKEAKKVEKPATKPATEAPSSPEPITSVETTKEEGKTTQPKTTVFVANLPRKFKVDELQDLFKDYEVESALVAIQKNGRSKGYGFVELKTVDEMQRVLTEFVDIEIEGHAIHVSAATSEKNTERKVKPRTVTRRKVRRPSRTTKPKEEEVTSTEEAPKKPKKKRSRKPKVTEKEKEGAEAAKEADEAVKELKKEDGVEAAKEAQEAVKELKKDDGVKAAKEAKEVVKEVKKEDRVKAAKEAKEAVKEVKKEDGVSAAKEANKSTK